MVTYDLAQYSWNDSETITVTSLSSDVIAVFPLSFLVAGGCGTWSYVVQAVSALVDVDDHEADVAMVDAEGAPVSRLTQELRPGVYRYEGTSMTHPPQAIPYNHRSCSKVCSRPRIFQEEPTCQSR